MRLNKLALITLIVLFTACVTMQNEFAPAVVGQKYPVRTSPDKIELYRSFSPAKSFKEIGTVHACCSDNTNAMIEEMRKTASQNGGDALVSLDIQATGGASATVVRYGDEPAVPAVGKSKQK